MWSPVEYLLGASHTPCTVMTRSPWHGSRLALCAARSFVSTESFSHSTPKSLPHDTWDKCGPTLPVSEKCLGMTAVSRWRHWWCHRWQARVQRRREWEPALPPHRTVGACIMHMHACCSCRVGPRTSTWTLEYLFEEQYLWSLFACRECMHDEMVHDAHNAALFSLYIYKPSCSSRVPHEKP
jgi:hypothetical protein